MRVLSVTKGSRICTRLCYMERLVHTDEVCSANVLPRFTVEPSWLARAQRHTVLRHIRQTQVGICQQFVKHRCNPQLRTPDSSPVGSSMSLRAPRHGPDLNTSSDRTAKSDRGNQRSSGAGAVGSGDTSSASSLRQPKQGCCQ